MFKKQTFLFSFFFIFLITSSFVSAHYWDFVTIGQGDARWCRLFGTCQIDNLIVKNLTIDNGTVTFINKTVININVTGEMIISGGVISDNITVDNIFALIDEINMRNNVNYNENNLNNVSNITADNFFGLANNSDKLDGIDSTQFLRSDVNDTLEAYYLYPNGTNPISLNHLVNKEFVELAVAGLELDYFFTNATSDISGYFVLNNTDRNVSETIVESTSLSSGNNQLIFNFSTEAGLPFIFLSEGIYDAHIHLDKTGGAAQTIFPRWELYKRNSSGEFFLMISETSDLPITSTSRKFDLHSIFDGDIQIVDTDRLVVKLFVDITGGGSSTVRLSMEGTTDSHFTFRTPSSVLEQIFLRRDGRNSPTNTISWDNNDLVGLGNVGIGTTTPTSKLHIEGGNINVSDGNITDVDFIKFGETGFKINATFNSTTNTMIVTNIYKPIEV